MYSDDCANKLPHVTWHVYNMCHQTALPACLHPRVSKEQAESARRTLSRDPLPQSSHLRDSPLIFTLYNTVTILTSLQTLLCGQESAWKGQLYSKRKKDGSKPGRAQRRSGVQNAGLHTCTATLCVWLRHPTASTPAAALGQKRSHCVAWHRLVWKRITKANPAPVNIYFQYWKIIKFQSRC